MTNDPAVHSALQHARIDLAAAKVLMQHTLGEPHGVNQTLAMIDKAMAILTEQPPSTAVQRFQERVVDMIAKGNTGWHISPGRRWHSMSIEDRCAAILETWDAPRSYKDFKDSYRRAVDDTNRMNDKGEIPNPAPPPA